jgi:ribosomal protein S18 acetylase RimI-like enzyme
VVALPTDGAPGAVGVDVLPVTERRECRALVPRRRWREMEPFLRRGDTGYLAVSGARFLGWVWVSRSTHRDPWSGLVIRLCPGEAYFYALWVEPDARRAHVARTIMRAVRRGLGADPAISTLFGWVDQRNSTSLRLLRDLGFQDLQRFRRVHVLHRIGWLARGSAVPECGPVAGKAHTTRCKPPGLVD